MPGIKFCTKRWETKDGQRIRICDMRDGHLINAVRALERAARRVNRESKALDDYVFAGPMPLDADDLEGFPFDLGFMKTTKPVDVHPLYKELKQEIRNRGLKILKRSRRSGVCRQSHA